jgi:hypothetical protein
MTSRRCEAAADQRTPQTFGVDVAEDPGVTHINGIDAGSRGIVVEDAPKALHIGKLWHPWDSSYWTPGTARQAQPPAG